MRVVIVHYHLRPGGVTRVIEHAVAAPASTPRSAAVLTGEPYAGSPAVACPVHTVPGLGYDRGRPTVSSALLADRLSEAARAALGAPPDLWHIHNYALGKNAALPGAVAELARRGHRLLCQLHDFAEDNRPADYAYLAEYAGARDRSALGAVLYPQGTHVHYAVLNRRDHSLLSAAGVASSQLHLLPNAVGGSKSNGGAVPASPGLYLYPTRAIRRKNLGEFILWSAVAREGERFAVTRAPRNPAARPVYERWVAFARTRHLPVEFAVAERSDRSFDAILREASFLVTTSVAEGFGLAFLEPWLAGRPLVGRNLPEVTDQLTAAGLDLTALYDRLEVPVGWVDRTALRDRVTHELGALRAAYGRPCSPVHVDRALDAFIRDDGLDFGRLDERLQEPIIERLSTSAAARRELRPQSFHAGGPDEKRVQDNRRAAVREFGLETYGRRLDALYRTAAASATHPLPPIAADILLEGFIAPERFSLLRTT